MGLLKHRELWKQSILDLVEWQLEEIRFLRWATRCPVAHCPHLLSYHFPFLFTCKWSMWLPCQEQTQHIRLSSAIDIQTAFPREGKFVEGGNLNVKWPCQSAVKNMFIWLLLATGKTPPPAKTGSSLKEGIWRYCHTITWHPSAANTS